MNTKIHYIQQAETICQQRGVRLTPQRAKIFSLLLQQEKPISAYDLLDLLRQVEPNAKPPTIYRALAFLIEQGLVHKIESSSSYIACHHLDHSPHVSALMICQSCQAVSEKNINELLPVLQQITQQANFIHNHYVLEIHGTCQHCQLEEKTVNNT